jgi:hypothetical protein
MSKNISPELAERLESAIYKYPTLYKSGGDVLHHLFVVNGNGYEWTKDGDLVSYPYDNEDTYENFEIYLDYISKRLSIILSNEDIERYAEQYKNITIIRAQTKIRSKDKRLHVEYTYPLCQYAKINTMPDNALPIWKEAAEIVREMLEWYPDYYEYESWKKLEKI